MAIDLPPAIPPQAVSAEVMMQHARAKAYTGKIGNYPVRVSGPNYLTKQELDRIFAAASTPSAAVRLIASATARKGKMMVNTLYSTRKGVVFIHSIQSRVAKVDGPARIIRFFDGLEGDKNLTQAEFERARVLADIYAGRAGIEYQASYRDGPTLATKALIISPKAKPSSGAGSDALLNKLVDNGSTDLALEVNNKGNRFVGRYLANLSLSHVFQTGTSVSAGGQKVLTDFGELGDGSDYSAYQFRLDHIFSWGLVGIDASHIEYVNPQGTFDVDDFSGCVQTFPTFVPPGCEGVETQTFSADADINRVALFGEHVLTGSSRHRFNLFERIEYIDSTIESRDPARFPDTNGFAQEEEYTTAELGLKYLAAQSQRDMTVQWYAQGSVKGGLDKDAGTFGTDTESIGPTAGRRTSEFVTINPGLGLQLTWADRLVWRTDFDAQIADEIVPQQQQWVLGGMERLAGFLPGVLVGDTGYFLRTDLNKTWTLDGVDYGLHFFVEYGSASYENIPGNSAFGDDRALADAGLKFTMKLGEWGNLALVSAHKIADDNLDVGYEAFVKRQETDFYFSLNIKL